VIVLDGSIVNVAIPTIGRELNFARENLAWIPNAYALTFGGFLLLGGRMADLLGRRRLFMAGLWVFVLASLVGGFSQSEEQLIACRAVQGLATAMIAPAALSMVTTIFKEGAERNKALGVWGAASGSGGAAGVLLGGVLTEYAGWEWVLWVNVPIGIVAALLAPRMLVESRVDSGARHFDALGAVVVTAGLSLLVFALVDTVRAGWGSTQTISLMAISLALIIVFVAIERRSVAPLVPFKIFRLRSLTGANIIGLLLGAALLSMFFFLSRYMQEVLRYDALKTGLSYLPLTLAIIVSAGMASVLVTKRGLKPVLISGLVLITIGLLWFTQLPIDGIYLSDIIGPDVARRFRPRLLVRTGNDRGPQRRLCGRLRAGVRTHQHLTADRRSAGPRGTCDDCQHPHAGPRRGCGGQPRRAAGRADRRLQPCLTRRRRVRRDRDPRRPIHDSRLRLAGDRRGKPGRSAARLIQVPAARRRGRTRCAAGW